MGVSPGAGMVLLGAMTLAALGACASSDASGGGPTVPPDTATAPTTIDTATIPDDITVAYADAVMDELDRLLGDAIRDLVANGIPTKRFDDLLNAVYDEPSLENKRSFFGQEAAQGLTAFKERPGDPETRVLEVLQADQRCVVLRVSRTFHPVFRDPATTGPNDGFIAWVPNSAASDPAGANPTAWAIVFDGLTPNDEAPVGACHRT